MAPCSDRGLKKQHNRCHTLSKIVCQRYGLPYLFGCFTKSRETSNFFFTLSTGGGVPHLELRSTITTVTS